MPRVLTRGIELYLETQIPEEYRVSRIRIDTDQGIIEEPGVLD